MNAPAAAPTPGGQTPPDPHLSASQRALLESELLARMREVDRRLWRHHGGVSRVEHAQELLERDADDASQHAMDREVDLGLSDREMRELDALGRALARIGDPGFGRCTACGVEIPFERLQVEPQAERCVTCESRLETRQALAR